MRVVLSLLIDEQINPKLSVALREKAIDAVSIHELELANKGFQDEPLLALAVQRGETLLSLDSDFLEIHTRWIAAGRTHYGIFYGMTSKYQYTGAMGLIVKFCVEIDTLIKQKAGTLEDDIYNQMIFISEG